jgi:hypothetical protein
MTVDYRQMLAQLLEERAEWIRRRDAAQREISKLGALIRAAVRMLPKHQAPLGERALEEIDNRPLGITEAVRLALMADDGREWMTPVEIREALGRLGFTFEGYRANPLVSIHAILKRMVPEQVETQARAGGQKVYRLKGTRFGGGTLTAARGSMKAVAASVRTLAVKAGKGASGGRDGSSRES